MFYFEALPDTSYPMKGVFTVAPAQGATYLWDFGNGTYSTEESPIVPYFHGGQYPVKLVVKKDGLADSITQSIGIPFTPGNIIAIYLIPKGEVFDPLLFEAIKQAMPRVQAYYKNQLFGKTFNLSDPVADTLRSDEFPVSFQMGDFTSIMNKIRTQVWGKLGNRAWPFRNIIVVFLPVNPGNALEAHGIASYDFNFGKHIALVTGVATEDLVHPINPLHSFGCFVTAHELGHMFHLPHNNYMGGLMRGGNAPLIGGTLLDFPDCFLLPAEKDIVVNSEFIH